MKALRLSVMHIFITYFLSGFLLLFSLFPGADPGLYLGIIIPFIIVSISTTVSALITRKLLTFDNEDIKKMLIFTAILSLLLGFRDDGLGGGLFFSINAMAVLFLTLWIPFYINTLIFLKPKKSKVK